MPKFEEHYRQYVKNIDLVNYLYNKDNFFDWKVTITFYAALHLINAHIDKKISSHFLSHSDTLNAINPFNQIKICPVTEDVYVSYKVLQSLSRRARYLSDDSEHGKDVNIAHLISPKHLKKSFTNLKIITDFFHDEYHYHIIDVIQPK